MRRKSYSVFPLCHTFLATPGWGGGGGLTWVKFCWVCAAGFSEPYPIIVNSVTSYRPNLSHFWANVIVISTTEFNASRLLNIKTTAETIFQPRIFLFLNLCLPEFSYPKIPEICVPILVTLLKMQLHYSQSSCENATPSSSTSPVVFY